MNKIYNIDAFYGFSKMDSKSIDHVFTSPPYNRKRNDKYEHYDDNIENYFEFLCNVIDESLRVSKKYVFINIMKNYYNKKDVFKIIGKYNSKIVDIIIWGKSNPLPASGKSITNSYEMIIVLGDISLKSNSTYTKNLIITSVNSNMPKNHKAVMKQEIADWFIENFTNEKEIILDCFMGVGTTAISCLKFNRQYIGFEINRIYVDDSINNIKNYEQNV